MKRNQKLTALVLGISLLVPLMTSMNPARERKIVMFRPDVNQQQQDRLVKHFGGSKINDLKLINGQSVYLPPGQAKALEATAEVLVVEEDQIVQAFGKPVKPPVVTAQSLPWGVDRVDAEKAWGTSTGKGIQVAVIDTGISSSHTDLHVHGGASFVAYTSSWNDDNGHGSHVAGTIAALDNSEGVVGVAPAADLYALKVLNRKGSGYTSDIIRSLEWCVNNPDIGIDVINMSLGSSASDTAFAVAVANVIAKGIVIVAASGNDGGSVSYPAAYEGVIAVGATDSTDQIAYFSNFGSQLAVVAPGVNINSTYKGTGYTTMSGTSMASPHVAGIAALILEDHSTYKPEEVRSELTSSTVSTNFSDKLWDAKYGFGLVNALEAVK